MSNFPIGRLSRVPLEMPNRRFTQPVTYNQLTFPTELPVSLDLVKQQLRITDTSEDEFLTLLVNAAREFFQTMTGRILITTEFETFRSFFEQSIELRRSKLVDLIAFQYLDIEDILITMPDIFYVNKEAVYSRIIIPDISLFPNDKADNIQSVRVDFTAGFGTTSDDIPFDIQMALLNHVAQMYANRGDCSTCDASSALPANATLIYNKYKIVSLYGGSYRGGI